MADLEEGGVYYIVNAQSGTVVDLSLGDGKTITGWQINGGDNQKWFAHQDVDVWCFQNALHHDVYLSIQNDSPSRGTRLQGNPDFYLWDVVAHKGAYNSITVPGAHKHGLAIDLQKGSRKRYSDHPSTSEL